MSKEKDIASDSETPEKHRESGFESSGIEAESFPELDIERIKVRCQNIESDYKEQVEKIKAELNRNKEKLETISEGKFELDLENVFNNFNKEIYNKASDTVNKYIDDLNQERASIQREILDEKMLSSEDLKNIEKGIDDTLGELMGLRSRIEEEYRQFYDLQENKDSLSKKSHPSEGEQVGEGERGLSADDLRQRMTEGKESDGVTEETETLESVEKDKKDEDIFSNTQSFNELADIISSRPIWHRNNGSEIPQKTLLSNLRDYMDGKRQNLPSVPGLKKAAEKLRDDANFDGEGAFVSSGQSKESKVEEISNLDFMSEDADRIEYEESEKDISGEKEQSAIDDLKKEIENINSSIADSTYVEKYGKDYHFDKNATLAGLESSVAEKEAKIRSLENKISELTEKEKASIEKTEHSPEAEKNEESTPGSEKDTPDEEILDLDESDIVTEDSPEEEGSSTEAIEEQNIKLSNEQIDSLESQLGISVEYLRGIEGFGELSEGQQALVVNNLRQLALGRIQDESVKDFKKDRVKSGFLGRIWKGITKNYRTRKFEKENLQKEKEKNANLEDGNKLQKEMAEQLVRGIKNYGPEVIVNEGKLEIQYARLGGELNEEERIALDSFNKMATEFSSLPDNWRFDEGVILSGDKGKYEKIERDYIEARKKLENIFAEKYEDTEKALQEINNIEKNIKINQFLNTNQDVEKELGKIENDSAYFQALKDTVTERGLYMGLGYAARTASAGLLGLAAAPLTAAGIGGFRGAQRGKGNLRDRDILARKGVEYTEKIKHEDAKEAELDKNIVDSENLVTRIENTISQIREAQGMEVSDDFTQEEKDKKIEELVSKIKLRVEFTEGKFSDGLISYGEDEKKVNNMYAVVEAIREANIVVNENDSEINEKTQERLNKFLNFKDRRIKASRRKYILKEAAKGAGISAAFAAAGVMIRDLHSDDSVLKGLSDDNDYSSGPFKNAPEPEPVTRGIKSNFESDGQESESVVSSPGANKDGKAWGSDEDRIKLAQEEADSMDSAGGSFEKEDDYVSADFDKENYSYKNPAALESEEESVARSERAYMDDIEIPEKYEVKEGDSIWNISNDLLKKHNDFSSLNEGQKTYAIDYIKDILQKSNGTDLQVGQDISYENIKAEDINKAILKAEDLDNGKIEQIEKNNEALKRFFRDHPEIPRTEENYEKIISGQTEDFFEGVDSPVKDSSSIDDIDAQADYIPSGPESESRISPQYYIKHEGLISNISGENKEDFLKFVANIESKKGEPINPVELSKILPGYDSAQSAGIFDQAKAEIKDGNIHIKIDGRFIKDMEIIIDKNGKVHHNKYLGDWADHFFKNNKEGRNEVMRSLLESSKHKPEIISGNEEDHIKELTEGQKKYNEKIDNLLHREQSGQVAEDVPEERIKEEKSEIEIERPKGMESGKFEKLQESYEGLKPETRQAMAEGRLNTIKNEKITSLEEIDQMFGRRLSAHKDSIADINNVNLNSGDNKMILSLGENKTVKITDDGKMFVYNNGDMMSGGEANHRLSDESLTKAFEYLFPSEGDIDGNLKIGSNNNEESEIDTSI